jgi:DNA-binding NarL/FixJ family response regulator
VKQGLLLEPSEAVSQHALVLWGQLLAHRKLFSESVAKAAGLNIIRCSENLEEALSLRHRVNVSLYVARQSFLEQLPGSTVMQLTDFGTGSHVMAILEGNTIESTSATKMLRLGCHGVLPRQFSSKLFSRAVLAVLRGQLWAPHAVVSDLMSDLLRAASLKSENGLTPQEVRILELSSQGYTNSAIADTLFISLETVRWHKRRLNRKLRSSSLAHHPPLKASSPPRELAAG